MSNLPDREPSMGHGLFGVFSVDSFGTVGDLVGMWHHSFAEAERYLNRVKEQHHQNYIALSGAEHAERMAKQQAAGITFMTGHDLLMAEFDQWLKDNHLIRAAEAAAILGLSDKEFKSVIKRGLIKRKTMPDHDNLIGFPANPKLTKEQHQQIMNEGTLNAHQVAEVLGVTQKEFNEIKRQSTMTPTTDTPGRTRPNESGNSQLYSRADVEKLRPAGEEAKEKRLKPPENTRNKR